MRICFFILTVFLALACKAQNRIISNEANFEISYTKQQQVTKLGKKHYLIDFGKACFGTVQLLSNRTQKDTLTIHLGEKLSDDKHVDKLPGATIRYQLVKLNGLETDQPITIELFPDKRNTNSRAIQLPDSFGVIMPFRYCEIENLQIPIEEIEFVQKAFHYKFNDEASFFTSSDSVLNQIWDLCKHTIKATSFSGYYVDGDRERIPYEADAYINQLSHYCVDSVYSIARRTNEYFLDHPTWPTEWLLHTVLLFYQDYMYTGDLSSIRKNYEKLKLKTLSELARADGLITTSSEKLDAKMKERLGFKNSEVRIRDIVDWPPGKNDSHWKLADDKGERDGYEMVAINTVVNSFYYYNLVLMAEIAADLNKVEDVESYLREAEKVKKSINQNLFDSSRGIYIDGEGSTHASLHANMFPLAFGLVPEEHISTVVDHIKSRGMACSVYGAQYLLEGLYLSGESQYALDLMRDTTHDRTWWNMIQIGSTMTLEAWDAKYKPNLDWNHAWGTAPLNIIGRHLWGITPATPGFKTVQIKPQMADLTSSEIKVPTLNGCIKGSYTLDKDGRVNYLIELPKNMTGEFIISDKSLQLKYTNKQAEIIPLHEGVNKLAFQKKLN